MENFYNKAFIKARKAEYTRRELPLQAAPSRYSKRRW